MQKNFKRILTAILSTATVLSFSSASMAASAANASETSFPIRPSNSSAIGIEDQRWQSERAVDPTDPEVQLNAWNDAPNNPANLPEAEAPKAWMHFYRDEAKTEEIALADAAVGDTLYYTVECAKGYYCTYVDINCPMTDDTIYADIPGSEIKITLTTALAGDIYGDGVVNARDVSVYMRLLLKPGYIYISPTMCEYVHGYQGPDINGDGKRNARDVAALMKYVLGSEELPTDHYSYRYKKYYKAYTISIQVEGSEEVCKAPLPAPLPTMELSEDKSHLIDYGITWTTPGRRELFPWAGGPYNGVTSKFWRGYTFVEMEMDIVEGDTLPVLRIEDVNAPYSGVLEPLYLQYSIPEGAKTVKATVRFAYLTDPSAQNAEINVD